MPPDHSQTLLGHFWKKNCPVKNVDFCQACLFSKTRLHMAALGEVLEAKCSYFDARSFMFSPHPAQNIALYIKILIGVRHLPLRDMISLGAWRMGLGCSGKILPSPPSPTRLPIDQNMSFLIKICHFWVKGIFKTYNVIFHQNVSPKAAAD